jgi:hypothetical protein
MYAYMRHTLMSLRQVTSLFSTSVDAGNASNIKRASRKKSRSTGGWIKYQGVDKR